MAENPNKSGQNSTWSALALAWELGYTIAIPIVVFALGGRVLDNKLGTSPFLLLVGIFLSLIATSWLVYFKMMKIIGTTPKETKDSKELKDI